MQTEKLQRVELHVYNLISFLKFQHLQYLDKQPLSKISYKG